VQEKALSYDIFVFHRSYFCGKMLAYLKYKGIPHTAIYGSLGEHGKEIYSNTGLRQMPVIKASNGQWMSDTTPMMDWFEERYSDVPVIPTDPVQRFLSYLMEDYADEWMWRPAIYYRWMYPGDRHMYKTLFAKEFVGGIWAAAKPLTWLGGKLIHRHQEQKFLYGDGMTEQNREHIESIYINTLQRLEVIFKHQDYLLGDRPSYADFGFFGSMFWHFGNDPTPNRIMQEQAPAVYEWVARMWNAKASRLSGSDLSVTATGKPKGWDPLLKDVCQSYLKYLSENAKAYENGQSTFDFDIDGYTYPQVHTSPYRVWCRERLQQKLFALSDTEQADVKNIIEPLGGWEFLTQDTHIQSNWDPEGIAPMCQPGKISLRYKLLAPFTGSNHVRSRRAWD